MRPGALGLFAELAIGGGVLGFIIGDVWLGRGNGLAVAVVLAALGLLLAWMLWRTRPTYTPEEIAAAVAERKARETAMKLRASAEPPVTRRAKVNVAKSGRPDGERDVER
jgi:hypothetical protein